MAVSDGVLADSLLLFSLILINGDESDAKAKVCELSMRQSSDSKFSDLDTLLSHCSFLTFGHHAHVYLESVLMGKEPLNPSAR